MGLERVNKHVLIRVLQAAQLALSHPGSLKGCPPGVKSQICISDE